MRKGLFIAAVTMVLLVLSPSRMFAQTGDAASIADAFNAAALDPAAETGMVTDDVTIRVVPPPAGTAGVWSGKAQARGFFGFVQGQNVHRSLVGSWQVTGDRVTGTVLVTNNDFAKWHVGAVQHQLELIVQAGKIRSFTSIMAPAERARVKAAAQAYQAAQPAPAPAPGGGPSAQPGMPATGSGPADPLVSLLGLGLVGMAALVGGTAIRCRGLHWRS